MTISRFHTQNYFRFQRMTGTNPEFVWQQFSFLPTSFQKGLIPDNDSDIFQTESLIQFLAGNLQKKMSFYRQDRKSTRLNSSHVRISYAVFCLKKKKQII